MPYMNRDGSSQAKSWVYTHAGYPSTLRLATKTVPMMPASYEILVSVRACALNPVDIQLMNLSNNNSTPDRTKIPGRDFAGIVLAVSDELAKEFKPGDEVMGLSMSFEGGQGCLAEVAQIDSRSSVIVKKPKDWSWTEAASIPLVWLTARSSIERCVPFAPSGAHEQMKVAILGGSSSTGIYAIKIARQRNWKIMSSCSSRNLDFVKSLGAAEVVDYTSAPTAVADAVKNFEPHAIVDCVGGTDCIGLAPIYVTIVGDKTARDQMGGSAIYWTHPRMVLRWLAGRTGVLNRYECIVLDPRKDWLKESLSLKGTKQVQSKEESDIVIDSVFDFGRGKEAFERMNTGRARGKVVVEIKQD